MTRKVALVTGASRGVGAATAIALAEAGYAVACAARSTSDNPQRTPGTLDEVIARIRDAGGTAVAVPTDLSDRAQVAAMVDTTVAELGRLDLLINNAAVTFIGDIDIPQHRHDLVMAIDLDAPIVACRHAIEHLKAAGEGRIVNVSSLAALQPFPAVMSYGIAKIGLERFSVDLARQLAEDRIAVNVFRIDVPVASEGFVANTPHADHSDWEPSSVAAEGIVWMVGQPISFTGRRESMHHLAVREGIMPSVRARPGRLPPTDLYNGLYEGGDDFFEEPHQEVTT